MRATDYARDLVALVGSSPEISVPSFGALAMAWRSQIERRIEAILDGHVNRRGASRATGRRRHLVVAMAPVSVMRLAARPATVAETLAVGEDVSLATEAALVTRPPQQRPQAPAISADEKWRAERFEMFCQLIQHAKNNPKDLLTILKMADAAAEDAAGTARRPSDADVTLLKARFAIAVQNLEAAETKLAVGLGSAHAVRDALFAALAVLRDPVPATAQVAQAFVATLQQQMPTPITTPEDKAQAQRLAALEREFAAQLVTARVALDDLRQRGFSANYPEVVRLQRIIADLEGKAADSAKPAAPAAQAALTADEQWRAERVAMFGQLLEHANKNFEDVRTMVQIGTMASSDIVPLEAARIAIKMAALDDIKQANRRPSDADVTFVKARFAIALRNIEDVERKFVLGLLNAEFLRGAMLTALAVLRDPAPATPQQTPSPVVTPDDKARAERRELIAQLREKASAYYSNVQKLVDIGTLASPDMRPVQSTRLRVEFLQRFADGADGSSSPSLASPTRATIAFPSPSPTLTRNSRSSIWGSRTHTTLTTRSSQRSTSLHPSSLGWTVVRSAPPLSDAALIGSLRNAPAFVGDANRADALIALAQGYAFTPEMVTLYVAAATPSPPGRPGTRVRPAHPRQVRAFQQRLLLSSDPPCRSGDEGHRFQAAEGGPPG